MRHKPTHEIWAFIYLGVLLGAFVLTLAASLMVPKPARAHDHNGMVFDSWCCNGDDENGDCHEIPSSAVSIDYSTGIVHVKLKSGDHPLVDIPRAYSKKLSDTRRSTNGLHYACLHPHPAILRCLYLPPEAF